MKKRLNLLAYICLSILYFCASFGFGIYLITISNRASDRGKTLLYRLKKDHKTRRLYLVKEWYNPWKKDKETMSIGPVDEIEHLVLTLKKQLGIKRLQKITEKLVRRPGFEPGITGLEGQRPSPG